jgi:hypothetical protein
MFVLIYPVKVPTINHLVAFFPGVFVFYFSRINLSIVLAINFFSPKIECFGKKRKLKIGQLNSSRKMKDIELFDLGVSLLAYG